jgi:ABC-type lipoprotein export system ATPase subunit
MTTLVMASHSPLTAKYSDRVLRMVDGVLREEFSGMGVLL